jgi:phage tail sheath gpL-like
MASTSTAVSNSSVARVVGIQAKAQGFTAGNIQNLPQRIMVVGQGSTTATYPLTKLQIASAQEAGETYGFGSPIHLAALQLLPVNGDGVGAVPVTIYPLEDDGSGVAATGDITPSGTQTKAAQYTVRINGISSEPFVVLTGASVADITASITTAISAAVALPVTATDNGTDVAITSKWAGVSANDIYVEIIGDASAGTTFAVTQPTGGLVNPDVTTALDLVGDVWESAIVNCLNYTDATTLDLYQAFGVGRWGALTKKPLVVYTGTNESDRNVVTTITDARNLDYINVIIPTPGSVDLPLVIAARAAARTVTRANDNPPRDYGSMVLSGIEPGDDALQWDYTERNIAVLAGSSTTEVKSGSVTLSDTVTCYHPEGDPLPAYRYVCDIVKLQNIIYNLNLIFESEEWDGAPLVPDDQRLTNPAAKQPKMAKAAVNAMIDDLGLQAILSDPETAKKNTVVSINDQNPKRLDIVMSVQLSGNANIISIDLNFGFYFGSSTLIA